MLEAIRTEYRRVRREVYERATRPSSGDAAHHQANQLLFRERVESICSAANLDHYRAATPEARLALWRHMWTKNRYAGIRAQLATDEISDLIPFFDNYAWFANPDWNIEARGHVVNHDGTGSLSRDFLGGTGQFQNVHTVANIPKLKKSVTTARAYVQYFDNHRGAAAIQFVTDGFDETLVWPIHARLLRVGYGADLTALHFMMDAGFQVIKPDVVISRLLLDWGWLRYAAPNLPHDLTRCDLIGKGRYGSRFLYTKPVIYRPVIDLACNIVSGLVHDDLEEDIGWSTTNLIREFDLFVVKAGQLPEREFGVEQRLYP